MDGRIRQSLHIVFQGLALSRQLGYFFLHLVILIYVTGVYYSHLPAADMEAKNIDWDTIVNLLPDGDGDEADEQRK
jgi:hypothetical protein